VASAPFLAVGVILCLALPRSLADKPVRWLLAVLLAGSAAGALIGGPVGAVYALSASIPGVIFYLLAVAIWPIGRRPRVAAAGAH
jgi:hypothetical protein